MSWSRLNDDWYDNPKVKAVRAEGKALHATSINYCSRHLTNGVISEDVALDLAGDCIVGDTTARDLVDRMVYHRLFDEEMAADAVIYRVHDFLEFHPTRVKVMADRKARQEGGRKGAENRWHPPVIAPPIGPPMGPPKGGANAPVPARPDLDPLVRGTSNEGTTT